MTQPERHVRPITAIRVQETKICFAEKKAFGREEKAEAEPWLVSE